MVIDLDSGAALAAVAEHVLLNPASNQKLLTAAAALSELGPNHRFSTGLYGVVAQGAVGDLVLRSDGDPALDVDDLRRLAHELVARGVARVEGRILLDQSRFDAQFVPPGFEQQPDEWAAFRAPVSAIALDRNTLTVSVMPARAGEPARTVIDPPGFALLRGNVQTLPTGRGQSVRVSLVPQAGRLAVMVSGHVAEGLPLTSYVRRIDDPRLYAGFVLKDLLGVLGVKVRGGVEEGGAGVTTPLVLHHSEPLSVLVYKLGKQSDNFTAEMLLKTLGLERRGAPGTSAKGAEVVLEWLRKADALEPGIVVRNGSGLYDANRVSASSLVRLLRAAYRDPSISSEFVAQLSIGGVDGTLRSRFRSERERRSVRAKTGTLSRVVALSGYVFSPSGRSGRAFSLIVNGPPGKQQQARERLDAFVERLAGSR
jgi:D-alanyl-D-alanine carboxypeptidase/D-alanyl-D-alanine-endopeptidase (penicillin-binding protein 4)